MPDQLDALPESRARARFGTHRLYSGEQFFGRAERVSGLQPQRLPENTPAQPSPQIAGRILIAIRFDVANQAVVFAIRPGAETERRNFFTVCRLGRSKFQGPESVNHNRRAAGIGQGSEEGAGLNIEGVDGAVAEIADEQGLAEYPEIRGGFGDASRGIQRSMRH